MYNCTRMINTLCILTSVSLKRGGVESVESHVEAVVKSCWIPGTTTTIELYRNVMITIVN